MRDVGLCVSARVLETDRSKSSLANILIMGGHWVFMSIYDYGWKFLPFKTSLRSF